MDDHKYKLLEDRIINLETEMENLHSIVAELDVKVKRQRARDFSSKINLNRQKIEFLESAPHKRDDPFTDWELVMWASYLVSATPRRDILETEAEVGKRASKIRLILEHYKAIYKNKYPDADNNTADIWSRIRTKDYLEYVLLGVPEIISQGKKVPMNFYIATSPWAINKYSDKVASWQKNKDLAEFDKPLGDND